EVFEGLCLLVAGVLLLTPGFLTDAAGALLLVPQVRALLYGQVAGYLDRHVVRAAGSSGDREPPILDAEFEEIDPDEAPPPRGSWGRDR
ncbi:MAG TPA: FxsA family protein, partial [Geminicoccaceae bacterium]|nr:FxsA family protein [Geminicoccaceae bacterium]